MKMRSSIFLLFSTLLIFDLSFAGLFVRSDLVHQQVVASGVSDVLSERIGRVENGLLPPVLIKGDSAVGMKLADRMKFYKTPGVSVAVISNGKIDWARGYGVLETGGNIPVTPETLFQAASISKPVAAMAALRLVQEGKLDLDEDVNKKLVSWKVPENDFTKEEKVTLRGLLSHSNSLTVHGFLGYASDLKLPTLVQILDGIEPANSKPIRVDGSPLKTWRYAGGGYVVMQKLVENVTGKPFPAFARETVLKKIGMKHSTYEQPLPNRLTSSAAFGHRSSGEKVKGNWHTYPEMTAAGLWTTPSDLARFAIEIQNSKAGKSNKVLSVKMIGEMLTPQIGGWGLGPELQGADKLARFAHGGANEGYRCSMVAYTYNGKGAVVMTNSDNGGALAAEIIRSIAREYGWLDYLPPEKVVVEIDPAVLTDYVGKYQLAPGFVIIITYENGKLIAQPAGQQKNEMYAESETEFFLKTVEAQIKFVKDAQGKVTNLILRQGRRETTAKKIE